MPESHTQISRRRFCADACQLASCATMAGLAVGCGGMSSSPTGPSNPGAAPLGVVPGRFAGTQVQVPVAGSALADVGGPVVAIAIVLSAVFIPVAFMEGMVGQFFYEFGLTVAFAVLLSLFVSFTLTPMLSARMLRAHEIGRAHV